MQTKTSKRVKIACFVFLYAARFFFKKNKVKNCPDSLIYYTTLIDHVTT